MSEEEKKAIEYLKNRLEILHNNTQWATENNIKVVLNLIEKQQKEIEELKEKNASLQKEIKLMKSININDNYISKDKVKNKIKELENLYKDKYFHIDYVKEILEKLLEE